MAEHALDVLRLGMQVLQLVSKLLLGQRGDLILGKRVNGAAFLVEHQVVLQRQFTDVIQWVVSFEKFAGHSDRTEIRILEKLEIRLTCQVLEQVVQRVVVEPETVARVERWVSRFAGRRELGRRGSWGNFRGRCRRTATNLGFVAKLAALYPEWRRAMRQVSATATNLGFVAKLAALHPESRRAMRQVSAATNLGFAGKACGPAIGVETGDAAGTSPPSGDAEIAVKHPTAIKRLLTGTNLLVGILIQ